MQGNASDDIPGFIHREWDRDVPPEVEAAARDIASRHGTSVLGVIFYGSCLRTGEIEEKILDFYVIVDRYRDAYKGRALAIANKILPPNVFYHEINVRGMTVRSKYAVLSAADLKHRTSRNCLNVSVWARFCQPCMLLLPRDDEARVQISTCVAAAAETMLANLRDIEPELSTSREMWVEAFEHTYAAELRSERRGKGLEIYLLDQDRYDALAPIVLAALDASDEVPNSEKRAGSLLPRLKWWARRWNGKIVSFLRLLKATTTFDGGIDYIAWKIRRHSGVEIEIKDWMRRHPVVAGVSLFWSARKKGAFK